VWKGNVYQVTEEKISNVGKIIGRVKSKTNEYSGDYFGDALYAYPKDTLYDEIVEVSSKEAIAVEVVENRGIEGKKIS
jgi:hypothetical protein